MEQKVIITDNAKDVNSYLEYGSWKIVSVTAQHVSNATEATIVQTDARKPLFGNFCFVLEKQP